MEKMVCGIIFTPNEYEVWLLLKARPKWQAGKFNGIGGHIEKGESPVEAMQREWQEETGEDEVQWIKFMTLFGKDFEVTFFRAHTAANLESLSAGESLYKFPIDNLPSNILYNINWLIPMALSVPEQPFYEIKELRVQ
ncbi:MAG: NUDIX domain-containing protein [Candidatus Omnitrophica bacterium]|jgi:8-oxo-dGTP diphosphatase|nr:NUDIX domain-containing protein [Candidatus Omnitrophota bacterium]